MTGFRWARLLLIVLFLFVVPEIHSAQEHVETKLDRDLTGDKVCHVDEAHKDFLFKIFRDKFVEVIKRRDIKQIGGLLHPEFSYGFGGGSKENFLSDLEQRRELWEELDSLLALGGCFVGPDNFIAPYAFFLEIPQESCADFDCYVIVGNRVNVRVTPDMASPISFQLSYNVVRVKDRENMRKNTWLEIATLDGRKGYVYKKYVRSPLDYRMSFRRNHGKWMAEGLYAGD